MELQEEIQSYVEASLPDPSVFLVNLKLAVTGKAKKISVFLDGDQGVTIEQCASVSRKVGAILEEKQTIDGPYNLEVSSPGADQPIRSARQLPQHIGRRFGLTLGDGSQVTGKLTGIEGDELKVDKEVKQKKKKKPLIEPASIPFSQVQEAVVLFDI